MRSALALGGVAAVGPNIFGTPAWAAALRRSGTTLESTLVKGSPGVGGYMKVVPGPGEPYVVRTDLGQSARDRRDRDRRAVLAFAQISDVHIVDAQSPMRVEWVDRYDDQDAPGDPKTDLFTSAYRPQEMLSAQIANAMVQAINSIRKAPVTGERLAFTIQTGDNSDNSQYNEVRWNIDVLDGRTVRPDSGDLTKYEGVADANPTYYDAHYWHPDATPLGKQPDLPKSKYGFPTVPGLLDAARKPFQSVGLGTPWYTAFGNHDGLVQGNFPTSSMPFMNDVAVGELKLITPPTGLTASDLLATLRNGTYGALLAGLVLTPHVRQVTKDPNRRLLSRKQVVEEHFASTGAPYGHGFTQENRTAGTAYYTFDQGAVRFIVLDTVNPNGYADGSIDAAQFAWLNAQLAASADKIVVLASHHTIATMNNPFVLTGLDPQSRVMGDAVKQVLLANPQVVAWVNGHTHRNQIVAHSGPEGGGFWEINTAAHIDWPQQSRIIEIVDNKDGSLSIFATVVDHAAPAGFDGNLASPTSLAALARELSASDWHERPVDRRGALEDRNVELLVKAPPALV